MRPPSRLGLFLLLLGGCLPDLADECGPQRPCTSGQCISGVCVARALDMLPADHGRPDGLLPDASVPDASLEPGCEAAVEICNGLDDDCDRRIDEGPGGVLSRPCYPADAATRGVGACLEGRSLCRDGAFGACEGARVPGEEFCNGLDDDCDGALDEASSVPCYGGAAETEGVGQCRAGRRRCVAAVASTECVDQVLPTVEICDGVDGDCDGRIDEGLDCACAAGAARACYAGPPQTEGVGRCQGGTQVCAGQRWGACRDAVLPGAERCNGLDDDCDGLADEGLEGAPCRAGLGTCATEGVLRCTPTGLSCDTPPAAPEREVCNGLDDDCDGRVDEGYNRGAPCRTGVGHCAAEGFIECAADGTGICRADPLLPTEERCNAADDDCDGRIDEGATVRCYPGPAESAGIGTCRAGEQACVNGAPSGRCRGAVVPVDEACDGRDRDCDGAIDEDAAAICGCAPGAQRDCFAGPPESARRGRCRPGVQRCGAGGTWGACEGEIGPASEQCDGIDDDCDGRVDEGAADTGRPCTRGIGACTVEGRRSCVAGAIVCDATPGAPAAESCNGVDDDCDGRADEGIAGVDQPCRIGQGQCEAAGRTVCRAAEGVVCAGAPVPPSPETCNALDDDCDGAIDEGVRNACGACAPPPPPDRCDGVDSDCDGIVDEAPDPVVGTHCVSGVGRCARDGRLQCGPGGLICVSRAPIGDPEQCNGVDDDCDGIVDEAVACVLPAADARCVEGACAVVACEPGFVDDDAAPQTGCERGCGPIEGGERLGPATGVGIAHADGITAVAWTTVDDVRLQIGAEPVLIFPLPQGLERPRPVFDGVGWRVVGRARIDDAPRAVQLDFEAQRIWIMPGVEAGTPDGRFGGEEAALAWIALPTSDAARPSLFVARGAGPILEVAIDGTPHPTAGPAIVGAIDGLLRIAVPVRIGEQTRVQVFGVGPAAIALDADLPAAGPIVGRLSAARTGRSAVIAHAGDGAIRSYQLTYAEGGAALVGLPPQRVAAGVAAVELSRSPAGLIAGSVGADEAAPCELALLRGDGAPVPGDPPALACSALSLAATADGPVMAWIDAEGIARWRLIPCR